MTMLINNILINNSLLANSNYLLERAKYIINIKKIVR